MRAIILAGLLFFMATPVLAADSDTPKGKGVSAKEAYELSEKCAKFAAEKFKEGYGHEGYTKSDDGSYNTTYSNHYNAKLNKCFVLITNAHFPKNNEEGVSKDKSLWDIHENQEMATLWVSKERGSNWTVTSCTVFDKPCQSESGAFPIRPVTDTISKGL